jgi:hypothetical protein
LRRTVFAFVVLFAMLTVSGCKKQEQCAAGDSPAVCQAFQECVQSSAGVPICREAERDANQKPNLPPANNGAGDALKH